MGAHGLLAVQGIEERGRDEVCGPYHGWRGDEEALANSTDRITDHLGRYDQQPLVCFGKEAVKKGRKESETQN